MTLTGTSGDTGPSSIEAVRGLDWIDIVVLFPHGYCTHIQELQMITTMAENVHCISGTCKNFIDVYTADTENGRLGTLGGDKLNR